MGNSESPKATWPSCASVGPDGLTATGDGNAHPGPGGMRVGRLRLVHSEAPYSGPTKPLQDGRLRA